jgi:hypothetical protein
MLLESNLEIEHWQLEQEATHCQWQSGSHAVTRTQAELSHDQTQIRVTGTASGRQALPHLQPGACRQ